MISFRQHALKAFCFTAALFVSVAVNADSVIPQTNVDQAVHKVDSAGVPHLFIDGIGSVDHPAWTALYALAYAGVENYDPKLGIKPDAKRFATSIAWLKNHLSKDKNGYWVWPYSFDSTYNDVSIKAPWSSAFGQAVGIQALLADWRVNKDKSSLEQAIKAAEALFVPLEKGGFLFASGKDIWFEEIPSSVRNPSHILNGHMRALMALGELKDATGDARYGEWFAKGSDTLLRWLPLYDAGYWLRYDLNPRKQELLFRLANPYGFANPELAIDRIVLRDPVSGKESVLDVGGEKDANGTARIAGNDWGQIERVDGRTVRRLKPVTGERETPDSEGQWVAPYTYFYLNLPDEWKDNLRTQRFELMIEYLDERPGNLEVQMRSIAPGSATFHSLADGELLLSGSEKWRQWKVPVKPRDLGNWVGTTYGFKHAEYLTKLAARDQRFNSWRDLARGYSNSQSEMDMVDVEPVKRAVTAQTPVLPFYSQDKNGVLLMHVGTSDHLKRTGKAVYSPYIVASQAIDGRRMANLSTLLKEFNIAKDSVKRKPAINWILDAKNQVSAGGSVLYKFNFQNVYNDVVTPAPWQSSFGQTYILKALHQTLQEDIADNALVQKTLRGALKAYGVEIAQGGLAHKDRQGGLFFEEVPNRTHVLNAQLSALPVIHDVAKKVDASLGQILWKKGLTSLTEYVSRFDTGYWLRYDLNPKKELLFQLDWLKGDTSPLIESIRLEAPEFSKAVRLDVGNAMAFKGDSRISGLDWSSEKEIDGRKVRSFNNGYKIRAEPVQGGTRQNVYALMQLPVTDFSDYFDIQPHRLVIRYKDVAVGKFVVKVQSISEGNRLKFVPLHNSLITTIGDQKWKVAVISVRPQDMGWYKGEDYQAFEVAQLRNIAKLTGDWFFEQYAERQHYFLNAKKNGSSVIVEPEADSPFGKVQLSLIDSSPTYEGFGFANALDGSAEDNYVASLEGVNPGYVSLRLERPASNGVLTLGWDSALNYPGNVKVVALNGSGRVKKILADVNLINGKEAKIKLSAVEPFDSLRIEFSQFVGQSRLLMRLIEFNATVSEGAPSDQLTVKLEPGEDYLDAQDERNPLRIFRLPVTTKVKSISDELVKGVEGDHEKILSFMKFINGFKVGVASSMTPEAAIDERVGACGSFTNTLLALSAAQGIEGRVISLLNYPKNDGHAVAEIKVQGKWALYDPTFGAFYTLVGSNAPLSFDEIKAGYAKGMNIQVHHSLMRSGIEGYTGKNIFTQASPSGVIGPDRPFYFPLKLSFVGQSSVDETKFGAMWQGAGYLGAATLNQQQEWTLTALDAKEKYIFKVVAKSIGGDVRSEDKTFTLRAVIFDSNGGHEKNLGKNFRLQRFPGPALGYSI
ncbi:MULTISPECIES: D-glucuronyl C5-epimerase family protein [Pseudomonas]|uniref:D-glucuronyl C5-epimerase family protein n=1 Tax=Pseudomonas TaxID=286 RepID=UPI0021179EC3|nr:MULTISPECIES: D-glucuronyl C5-epimerase family protein [Pseudomonas]